MGTRARKWVARREWALRILFYGGLIGIAGGAVIALDGAWGVGAALAAGGLAALVVSGAVELPRSEGAYYKRLNGIWSHWCAWVDYLYAPPTSRDDIATRLWQLQPPGELEEGHKELLALVGIARRAEEDAGERSPRFEDLRRARSKREQLIRDAAASGNGAYGEELAALADESRARWNRQTERALDATGWAIAKLERTKVPPQCRSDHERLVAALARYGDVIHGRREAFTSLDEDELVKAEILALDTEKEARDAFESLWQKIGRA